MNEKSWYRLLGSCSDNQKSKNGPADQTPPCRRKWVGIFAIGLTLAFIGASARAQQPTKIPRIGFLAATKPTAVAARVAAFRQGLREVGYVEGKNIVVEYRYADGSRDRERELA